MHLIFAFVAGFIACASVAYVKGFFDQGKISSIINALQSDEVKAKAFLQVHVQELELIAKQEAAKIPGLLLVLIAKAKSIL